jgi:hypothetical protein
MKMKEDTEKERLAQVEQEEMEKQKRISRRSSSPALRQSQPAELEAAERSAFSEPIPRQAPFVSYLITKAPFCF